MYPDPFYVNEFGESIAEDATIIAGFIRQYVEKRGATLGLSERKLANEIMLYIEARYGQSRLDVGWPAMKPIRPKGWTQQHEQVWRDWIHLTCDRDAWMLEVFGAYFGTDHHIWEGMCDGWRAELHEFLPWWIQRNLPLVSEFDLTPESDVEEEDMGVDAYLLDHGSAKQKRAAGLM
jgi:hypothetical protein